MQLTPYGCDQLTRDRSDRWRTAAVELGFDGTDADGKVPTPVVPIAGLSARMRLAADAGGSAIVRIFADALHSWHTGQPSTSPTVALHQAAAITPARAALAVVECRACQEACYHVLMDGGMCLPCRFEGAGSLHAAAAENTNAVVGLSAADVAVLLMCMGTMRLLEGMSLPILSVV